jgi:hypothetical protein
MIPFLLYLAYMKTFIKLYSSRSMFLEIQATKKGTLMLEHLMARQ